MMYYKEINGRKVFSDCKTICLSYDHPPRMKGQWVSNPDSQLIYDEDWRIYVPPVVPPVEPEPQTEPDMEAVLEAVKKLLSTETSTLSDEDALAVAALFATWSSKIGEMVSAGERLWYDGKLYKVLQPHTVQEDWTPDVSPSLYTEVSIEEIPEWVQPTGSTDVYMTGDKVKHDGHTWESEVDNNSWVPGVYGWRQID